MRGICTMLAGVGVMPSLAIASLLGQSMELLLLFRSAEWLELGYTRGLAAGVRVGRARWA
jgi:hypothetical protein